ncbi:MAG: Gfo/Idh/MocA family oxidoreductase [Deltaproteobacteria bacterium]|nr:Gfo/Idh/MocA family oxidoreductase [Deltaproteobacteria bacterium]
MKRRINIGLIGVGRLGTMYAEFISYRVPQANLIAVADLIEERAVTCAEKYNVPKWYIGHQDLCDDKDIKAVIVVATTTNHKEIVLYAAKAGKSIFCEKPLTLNLKDARELEKGVQESGVFFQQGFQRRFDKGYMAAKKKIDAGEIGRPVVFRGSSRDPYRPSMEYLDPKNSGGQFIDMAIHDIDTARWYMGEVKTVYAMGDVWAYPEMKKVGDTDNAIMVMRFEDGAIGEIDLSRNGIYGYDIRAELLGTKGTIKIGYLRETPILVMNEKGVTHDVVPYFPERFGDAYVTQLNDYLDNLVNDKEPLVKFEDGIKALQIATAATISQKEDRIVRVNDV